MIGLTHEHLVDPPAVLALASRCFGLMAQSVPAPTAHAFRQRMSDRLLRAGAGLERHFLNLRPGDGMQLLRHSYALIIGLWQMSAAAGTAGATKPEPATSPHSPGATTTTSNAPSARSGAARSEARSRSPTA